MSHYTTTPVPPRPATQQDVTNQIEQVRRQYDTKLAWAQEAAVNQAVQRASEIQREQISRIQRSIDVLDNETRRNLDNLDRRHRQQMEDMTRRVYSDIEKTQRNITNRVNQQIADLASDVSDRFRGIDTRLQQQQHDINAINNQMAIIVDDINNLAEEISNRFEENERTMSIMQDDIADLRARFENDDEFARQEVETALALLDVVEKRTLLDRFAPGYEAQDVRNRVKSLRDSNLHGPALTAKAEETITQIWQAESHAIQEKAKHDALVEVALTQVEKVLTVVNNNRMLKQEIEGGEPMELENEFWSDGEYGRLEKELKDLKAELDDRYNQRLTRERVEEIARRSAEIERRIIQISAESVAKAILSEARVETVEDIVNAMEGKGWTLKGSEEHPEFDYMGGKVDHDWRQGVCAVLENNVGEEITIIVDPVSDSQNRLIVHQETSQTGQTDIEVKEKMRTIEQELRHLGYEVGTPVSGVANIPEMGSAERLGKAQATEKVSQKIK